MLIGLIAVLAALNAASYVQQVKPTDTELEPNRSTFNNGSTGTQAFFTLLNETGRKPVRWQEAPDALLTTRDKPAVFLIIGKLRREVTDNEAKSLFQWVSQGGRLVVIDRDPPKELVKTSANWKIAVSTNPAVELLSIDPSDQKQMTSGTEAAKPVQPTIFTSKVNAVQPSRFAGWITFERYAATTGIGSGNTREAPPFARPRRQLTIRDELSNPPPPAEGNYSVTGSEEVTEPTQIGPVVHLAGNQKNLLVDVPYGSGTIVYLTDPYIVSNGGISIVDNLQLALNLVSIPGGPIAFDEFHQGYGTNSNRFLQYFQGTPVIAIFLQCGLIVIAIFFSQSHRFARAVPEKEPDRLSKLEYVAAMAELQRRTRAYDLAIENIYTDFRRRVSRLLGADNMTTTRHELAQLIAERTTQNLADIENLLRTCEEIVHGAPTGKTEVVMLAARLRELEEKVGIMRTAKARSSR